MNFHLTKYSYNRKTGHMPVSTSDKRTCWKGCALYRGCYGNSSHLAMWWSRVTKGKTGIPWNEFISQVRELPNGTLYRINQVGDLPGFGPKINARRLRQLVFSNKGKKGFTFTHKPMTSRNRKLIKEANQRGFTINLSANNPAHADQLSSLKIGPVATVLRHDFTGRVMQTPSGRTIIRCPATYTKSITCKSCGICQVSHRKSIVGFPAQGRWKEKISESIV